MAATAISLEAEERLLDRTWREPRGLYAWLSSVDHRSIGRRFMITTFIFFLLGGLEAAVMRLQLARPGNDIVGNDLYDQLFTMHGSTMMFLFAVPVMEAVAIYVMPLMLGARQIAFPRLVAFGYWMLLFGGVMLYGAFIVNSAPDVGWFAYVPLSGPEYGPGKRADFWAQMITFTELSGLVVAVSLITTTFKFRAPGMSLSRLPLFTWATLVTDFMILFALPAVMVASSCLIMDRLVGTHFFNQAEGGDPVLFQHLFWFFGHPEVYIIFLPAQGMVSMIVSTFARRPVFGYTAVVLALIATGFLAFGLWVHHMFATGLPQVGESYFTAASMLIAIPSGVQIFCWIATLWDGKPVYKTPLLFVLGFFFIFIIGGLSGMLLAAVPVDLEVHDSYFVVAHFHYVLIGGSIFPLFGAFYYWFPKFTGRMMSETLGRWNFWLFFIGFNLAFFPMHQLGLLGMPRRVYTYQPDLGWNGLNLLSSAGAVIIAVSVVVFLGNFFWSLRRGQIAGDNPWDGGTLEWGTASPPEPYNFLQVPVVTSREPLWSDRERGEQMVVTGLRSDERQILVTTLLDAEPDHKPTSPQPSIWPFLTALATTALFIGSIFTPWAIVWGAIPMLFTLVGWFWPKGESKPIFDDQRKTRADASPQLALEGAA